MTDLQDVFRVIDRLSHDELNQVRNYIEQRRRTTWWVVPPENLQRIAEIMRPLQDDAAQMSEDEINAIFDEALDEVRRERTQNQSRD